MLPPFVVYDGTKITAAKLLERTLAYKYRNWRNSKPGRTGRMTFQKKHWFDADITIMWLEFLLDELFPGKKVGLSMGQAPCHKAKTVQAYIKKMQDMGRLALEFIDGGLTSVIQVCDLDGNKPLNINIKRRYLRYRSGFIKAERAKYPDEPNKRVQMKKADCRHDGYHREFSQGFQHGSTRNKIGRKNIHLSGTTPLERLQGAVQGASGLFVYSPSL